MRIEHQVVGYYVVGGGSAEAVMSPDRGRVIDHGCALRWIGAGDRYYDGDGSTTRFADLDAVGCSDGVIKRSPSS